MNITYDDLKKCRDAKKEIRELENRIIERRSSIERMTPIITGMPKTKNGGNSIEDGVIKLVDEAMQWEEKVEERRQLIQRVHEAIFQLSGQQQRILTLRYIDAYTWDRISSLMSYDRRWCTRLHKRALNELGIRDA